MAPTDKRKLTFEVDVDDKASRPLKGIGDQADRTKDDFQELNRGLKSLDDKISGTTKVIAGLRAEVAKSGDLELIKDIQKQEARLKALGKQRKALLGPESLIGDGADVGLQVGAKLGPFIVRGLGSKLGGLGPGAAIGAPIVAGVAAWLGSAAAGATLGAAAVGAVAGGVALAARDSRVKTAGMDLGQEILGQLGSAASAFVPATLDGIALIRGEFKAMDSDLKGTFDAAARYVHPLVRGVTGLVREALPGIRRGIEGAGPVIRALETGLPRVGRAVGDLFGDLSDDAVAAGAAIEHLFGIISGGIRVLTGFLEISSKAFGAADRLSAAMSGNYAALVKYSPAAQEADDATGGFAERLKILGQTDPGIEELWQRQSLLNKSFEEGIEQAEGFKEALDVLNAGALDARAANRAYQAAIDDAAESLKEHGKTLNANTAAGRANQEALDAIASSAAERAAATYEEKLATEGSSAAQEAATRQYEQGRRQLIKTARQMGMNAAEAKELADRILAIPRQWSTAIRVTGHKESVARANEVQRAVNRLTGKTIRIGVVGGRGGHLEGMSTGGRVGGSGYGDTQVRALDPEEHVFTRDEVRAAGGHPAIEELRRSLRAGSAPASAAPRSAAAGGGSGVAVVELRPVGAMGDLDRLALTWLQRALRTTPGVVLRAAVA